MSLRLFLSLLVVFVVGGCGDDDGVADGGGASDGAADAGPTAICRTGAGWSPGAPAFEERSMRWGLAGVNGSDPEIVDLDGDGWFDLVVPHHSVYDRTPGQVFMNREAPDGTRHFVERRDTGLFRVRDSTDDGRSTAWLRFGDVDDDGDLDAVSAVFAYLTDPARTPLEDLSEVLLNDGTGTFTMVADQTIAQWRNPLTSDGFLFDHDLDGVLDLALGYWYTQPPFASFYGMQPQLFHGDGSGRFTDVTEAAGMFLEGSMQAIVEGRQPRPLQGFTMCDVNDDGRQDLVGAAYGRELNELFLADGDAFTEVGPSSGVGSDDRRDFSDDWSFQCYCARTSAPECAGVAPPPAPTFCNVFMRDDGRGWFPGSSDQPWLLGGNTFCHACADVDNDGDLDLYEANIRHPDVGSASDPSELLLNDGTGNFTRPGREGMGLVPPIDLATVDEGAQQAAAFDFDNDGRLDLYLGASPYPNNRGWLFHQTPGPDLGFEHVGATAGFDHACANGFAAVDLDHDGDLDVLVGTAGCNPADGSGDWSPPENQPIRVYENVSNDANFVSIRLVGAGRGGANRFGVGARVRVTAGGVTQTRIVSPTSRNTWYGHEAFFGLGAACTIDQVEVTWPDGARTTQTFTGVVANQRVEIRQGDPTPRYLP